MPTTLDINFENPSLQELIDRISGDLKAELSGIDPYVPGSDEWVIARVFAGTSYLQNLFLKAIMREIFVGSAMESNLERIGGIWGVTRNQPTNSHYTVEIEATDATTIPAATLITSADGIEFLTDSELVFSGAGTDTVDITSVEVGTTNNLEVGAILSFTVVIPDVEPTITLTTVIEDAADIETLEAYRTRILERIQHHPQGGSYDDYIQWTLDVDGVERVWVDSPSLGTVRVVFDGVPAEETVEAAIDAVKPVTAIVTAIKATELPIALDVSVKRESGYSTSEVLANIKTSLAALFEIDGAPSTTVYNSELRQAVSNAIGVDYYILNDIIVDGTPTATVNDNVTSSATQYHALDEATQDISITWL